MRFGGEHALREAGGVRLEFDRVMVTPCTIAARLTLPERVLLIRVASGTGARLGQAATGARANGTAAR